MIDKDEFDQWRDNVVTRWFFEAVEQAGEDQREKFLGSVFYGDMVDPAKIGVMRGAFIGIMQIAKLTYDEVVLLHESGELTLDLEGVWITPGSGERQ